MSTPTPAMYNSQPWGLRLDTGAIAVYVDPSQRLPTADPNGWASRVVLGTGLPQMLIPIGLGDPGIPTPRRPIEDVIDRWLK